ncbi:t-SNARE [Coprinopsis marcescibilis]|uniref:t-SNARE n=1 Tax=Coprinopsis marcescibilis TaxID=230819 RepID=A0A5C3LAN4_COPMA|nr:t-SNARE [Coprinopsis marcescibilis]
MAPAVDRLAAARAHRSQATARPQIPPADSDFPSDSTSSNYDEPFPSALGAPSVTLSRSAFLSEVSSVQVDVQSLNGVVAQIAAAHSLHLSSVDTNPQIERDKLDRLTADAHLLMRRIKERIQRLEGLPVHEDAQIRINQISVLRRNFLESLQNYQKVEFDADLRFKRTIGNRLKLVKPDVTSEEVDSFVEGGNQQVFAQALINSTRYGESRRAFREVEERHNELQRMERTLLDLTRLFNDARKNYS